jgi:hypothetical protein
MAICYVYFPRGAINVEKLLAYRPCRANPINDFQTYRAKEENKRPNAGVVNGGSRRGNVGGESCASGKSEESGPKEDD